MSRVFHRATFHCCSYMQNLCDDTVLLSKNNPRPTIILKFIDCSPRVELKTATDEQKCPIPKNKPKKSSLNESFLSCRVSFTSQIIICTFSREKRSLSLLESI